MKKMLSYLKSSKLFTSAVSCLLALSVVISAFAGMNIFAGNTSEVWSGEVASGFKNGAGTKTNPYKISNGEELALAVTQNGGYYYEMENDIYLNDVSAADWKNNINKEWKVAIVDANGNGAFKGVFNGNGYKVYGLYTKKTYTAPDGTAPDTSVAAGLFPTVAAGAQIYGVGIEDSYISLKNDHATADMSYVGYAGLVGYAYNGSSAKITIDRCYLGSNVTVNAAFIGLVGTAKSTSAKSIIVTNCYSQATGTAFNGGTISNNRLMLCSGLNHSPYVLEYCYSTAGLSNSGHSAITTTKYNYSQEWCSSLVGSKVSADKMRGENAFTEMVGINTEGAYKTVAGNYPILKIFDKQTGDVWDGKTLTAPESGDGSANNPYVITTPYELAYAIKYPASGATYKLAADIYLNDIEKVNWTTGEGIDGYKPNSWFSSNDIKSGFNATFIGDGYMVYGLYYNDTATTPKWDAKKTGLIPAVNEGQTATVSGVGVDYAYMNGPGAVAAVVAYARGNSIVSNSFAGANVTLKGHCTAAMVAINARGLYEITNCYSLSNITTTGNSDSQHGLLGDFYGNVTGSFVKNSYNANGPISSKTDSSYWANNYATEKTGRGIAILSAENMQGLDALKDTNKMANLGAAFLATTTYPILIDFYDGPLPDTSYTWDGSSKTAPEQGSGTAADPYLIESGAMLAYAVNDRTSGVYYKLVRNIYLNDVDKINWSTGEAESGYTPNVWFASGTFGGHLDGDGYTVYGMYYNDPVTTKAWNMKACALIPAVGENASVKNIGVDKAYVHAPNGAGGIVGAAAGTTYSINSCYVGKDVTLCGYDSGALVAVSSGKFTIANCYSFATSLQGIAGNSDCDYGLFGDVYSKPGTENVKNSVMANCFNANGPMQTKGLSVGSVSAVYATEGDYGVVIAPENMQGLDVFALESKMPKLNSGRAFYATETYPVLKIFADEASGPISEDIWSGSVATTFPQGDGTEQNPFVITNGAELALAVGQVENYYYILNNDIYLNDVSVADWQNSINNIEWLGDTAFKGHIDGKGYIVYGIWYAPDTAKTTTGLINYFNGGSVKNIGVRYAQIYGQKYAGLIGSIAGTKSATAERSISSAFVDDTVTVGFVGKADNCGAGGIVGIIDSVRHDTKAIVTIENCYSKATVTGLYESRTNGIIGTAWKSSFTVKNCYSVGLPPYSLKSDNVISWLIYKGADPKDVISGVYATTGTPTEKENYTIFDHGLAYGDGAKTQLPALDYDNVWDTAEQGTPKLKVFTSINGNDKNPVDGGPVWNGVIATEFASGSGTEADPYIITKGSELALAVQQTNGSYYKLAKDIYLNDVNLKNWKESAKLNEWVTTDGFKGHLDGNGYIVYGIYYSKDNAPEAAGLVSAFSAGSIKNIGVRYAQVSAQKFAGGIVGRMVNHDKKLIEGCFADETVSVEYTVDGNYGAGGIVGMIDSIVNRTKILITIKNCYSKAVLSGFVASRINGIVGSNWKSAYVVENCYSVGVPPYYAAKGGFLSSLAVAEDGSAGAMSYAEIYKNVYSTKGAPTEQENYTVIADQEELWSNGAKTKLSGFDFENVWQAVEKGTPKLKIFADLDGADIEIGEEDSRYESGIGTKNNPYIIKTAQQLRNLVTATDTKGKYYKLANDIYVNDVSKSNWTLQNPEPWYESQHLFRGTLDGDGHFIYGLYLNETAGTQFSYTGAGLFTGTDGATIKNVHIRKSYIAGSSTVGSIVGVHRGNTTIIACSADDTVTLKGYTVGGLVGGGGSGGLKLYYSYFTGKLTGGEGVTNGLVGDIWKSEQEVVECYSIGYKPYRHSFFPASAFALYGTVAQGKTKVLTSADMKGAIAKQTMSDLDWKNVWTVKEGQTPHPKVVDKASFSFTDEGVKGRVWSGRTASKFAGGSGTETDPYLIETPEQLALLINTWNTAGKYYKLTADIKLNDTSKANWTAKANQWYTFNNSFRGNFDGAGHVVSGLFFNTLEESQAGLFPTLGPGAVIKRVGIINSSIINNRITKNVFAGALVGSIQGFTGIENPVYPVISQCFVDHSVYVEGYLVGGLIGGTAETVYIDNCYVTCELFGESLTGSITGTAWKGDKPLYVTNSYLSTKDRDNVILNNAASASVFRGVYNDGKKGNCAVTSLGLKFMQGENAKEYMPELDYVNIWMTVEGGTPVLRCFRNAAKYSCTREPKKTEMSFASNEGSECKPIYGFAGDVIDYETLPVPERYGYKFLGWRTSKNLTLLAEEHIIIWPDNDFIVHAKWEQVGYEQGFDANLDENYDYNEGVEHYRPGVTGYNPKNIQNGLKSMHTLPEATVDPIFLVNYELPLEKGKEYDVNFWIKLDAETTGNIDFIHADHPQHNSPTTAGYQSVIDLSTVKVGAWIQYKATITASAPYLLVRVPAGTDMYFDAFHIVHTGKSGELEELEGFTPSDIATEPTDIETNNDSDSNLLVIILASVGGAILLAAVATVVIIRVKKGKKAKTN